MNPDLVSRKLKLAVAGFFGFAILVAVFFSLDSHNAKLEMLASQMGGRVQRDYSAQKIYRIPLAWIPRGSKLTAWMYPVESVDFSNAGINDQQLAQFLGAASGVHSLRLDGNPEITDRSITQLNEVQSLTDLSIVGTSISSGRAYELSIFLNPGDGVVQRQVHQRESERASL